MTFTPPRITFGGATAQRLLPLTAGFLALALSLGGCGGGPERVPAGARRIGAGETEGIEAVGVEELGAFLGLGYLFKQDVSSSGIELTEHLLQERIGLGASGSIYSPKLLRYELSGVFGLVQDWLFDQNRREYDDGTVIEGFGNLNLFPMRWHPANVFFSRTENVNPRVFGPALTTTTTTGTASQYFRSSAGQLRLQALYRDTEQEGFATDVAPFTRLTEQSLGVTGDYRLTSAHSVGGGYTYQDIDQDPVDQSSRAHRADGQHVWSFHSDGTGALRSRIELVDQQGALNQRLVRWTEHLDLTIVDALRGDADFRLERNDTSLADLKLLQGNVGLHHTLFESLFTSLRITGGRQVTDGLSTTDTLGSRISLAYRKVTPVGLLRMSYTNVLERRLVENDRGAAIEEPHTFPLLPPEEVELDNRAVDPASLIVTDPAGIIFYRETVDYTVRQDAADRTFLVRVFTGSIPPGGTILVSYNFQTGTDFTLDSVNHDFRLEHEFIGGWTPYFSYGERDQMVRDVEGPGVVEPIDERSLVGGLEWRQPSFILGAEYEDFESTIQPFDAIRLHGEGSLQIDGWNRLSGGAAQSWLFYREPKRDLAVSQVTARWGSTFLRDLVFSLDIHFRYEEDSIFGESLGFSAGAQVDYTWREIQFRLRVSHRETRGSTTDYRGEKIGFYIVRSFGAPPASTRAATQRFLSQ